VKIMKIELNNTAKDIFPQLEGVMLVILTILKNPSLIALLVLCSYLYTRTC
jgi:hypothetical protein